MWCSIIWTCPWYFCHWDNSCLVSMHVLFSFDVCTFYIHNNSNSAAFVSNFLIGVSLSETHIDHDNRPTHRILVSDYINVSFTLRLSHHGSQDQCTPWNAQCAHMHGLQLHSTEQQGWLELLVVSQAIGVGYVHRRLSSTMSMCAIWVCANYHILTTFAMARAKAAKLWHVYSRGFPWVSVYLAVKVNLSKWKAARCG